MTWINDVSKTKTLKTILRFFILFVAPLNTLHNYFKISNFLCNILLFSKQKHFQLTTLYPREILLNFHAVHHKTTASWSKKPFAVSRLSREKLKLQRILEDRVSVLPTSPLIKCRWGAQAQLERRDAARRMLASCGVDMPSRWRDTYLLDNKRETIGTIWLWVD